MTGLNIVFYRFDFNRASFTVSHGQEPNQIATLGKLCIHLGQNCTSPAPRGAMLLEASSTADRRGATGIAAGPTRLKGDISDDQ